MAGSVLDVARRQLAAIDIIVERPIYRLSGRDPRKRPPGPPELVKRHPLIKEGRGQVTGRYAGPVSRAAAFAIDAFIAFWVFTLGSAGLAWVFASLGLIVPAPLDSPWAGVAMFVLWCFMYWWIGLALTGRTIGKGILGLRVLQNDGDPVTGMEAALRTVVLPVSFLLLGLGVIVVLISPHRRTLHDAVARTCEVYDWGDRAAELPAPLTAWIARQAGRVHQRGDHNPVGRRRAGVGSVPSGTVPYIEPRSSVPTAGILPGHLALHQIRVDHRVDTVGTRGPVGGVPIAVVRNQHRVLELRRKAGAPLVRGRRIVLG